MQNKKLKFKENGITLIALVITIIVLLILAGISIAMLTGQNGILTQAQNAKIITEQANAQEKVELAVTGAMSKSRDGSLTIDNLKEELSNYGITIDKTDFPVEIELDGQKLAINNSGKVTNYKEMTDITGQETANTTTKDSFGNYIVIPAGFKIVNSTENVPDGIIVEDVSHEATAGSQFVWVPLGNVKKDGNGNTEIIKLSRYTFNENGQETDQNLNIISNQYIEDTVNSHNNNYGNIIAKNIEDFKNKAQNNYGYYIGRYEARKNGTQLTEKANDTVFNKITQTNASRVSIEMYNENNFESDLMNSYAWDTAITFLQKFDNRSNKSIPYSRQISLNYDNLAIKGTNNLSNIDNQDVICNIWDMASNCSEWSTETCQPCTVRRRQKL